ncbi:flagellar export chaperone FliS [Bacillus sp. B15-48]|uniref:flagellar export chaperone FliS n=1 Tax=Bacillus sp. B15-48 TaxID=1548601 RepID=UPI00193F4C0D|nr:flagellar export chaperone FliS [Bacillus sp. B15-48]MBM4764133.1 flagellar export chaperone FliS [Bacillus sp. B15-48]
MYSNPNEIYQRNQVTTAKPEELTLMLYNGAIKFLHQAKQAIEKKDYQKAHTAIVKTQDIVTELMVTLNMDISLSNSLYNLYDFMKQKLVEANIAKDSHMLDEVESMFVELRNSWAEAIKSLKNS